MDHIKGPLLGRCEIMSARVEQKLTDGAIELDLAYLSLFLIWFLRPVLILLFLSALLVLSFPLLLRLEIYVIRRLGSEVIQAHNLVLTVG